MTQFVAGRSISSSVVGSVLQTTRLFKRFNEIVAASSASEMNPAVGSAIAQLTYELARASVRGRDTLTVMQLREGQNFRRQIWYKRLWYGKPRAELLFDDARAVYDFCLVNGLNPDFARYEYDRDYSQLVSSMKISWDNQRLSLELAKRCAEDIPANSFCQALKTLMPDEKQLAVVARARRSQALLIMPLVIRNLDAAAKNGRSEVVVYRQSERSHLSPDLCADIKDFCLILGLKAVLASDCIAGEKYSLVTVSGWTETQEQLMNEGK
jgi:hypothetical protein